MRKIKKLLFLIIFVSLFTLIGVLGSTNEAVAHNCGKYKSGSCNNADQWGPWYCIGSTIARDYHDCWWCTGYKYCYEKIITYTYFNCDTYDGWNWVNGYPCCRGNQACRCDAKQYWDWYCVSGAGGCWYNKNGYSDANCSDCGSSGWTNEYRCSGNSRQQKYCYRGCSGGSCYANCEWRNVQDCGGDYWTNDYRCSGNTRQRRIVRRGCSGSSCYSYSEWINVQDCGGDYWTEDYRCVGTVRQQRIVRQGCSGTSCYSYSEWINVGTCNSPPNTPVLQAPPHNTWINYNPTFQARVSDPDGNNVRAYFSYGGWGSWVGSGGTSSWGPAGVSDTSGTWWQAYAQDSNGATSGWSGSWLLKKDTNHPTASLDQENGISTDTAIWVNLSEQDALSGINQGIAQVRINQGSWTDYASTINDFTYTGVNGSTYEFRYQVMDNAGNWSDWAYDGSVTICTGCIVEGACRTPVSKACTADNAKDHSISELGDSIDDYWCTWNEHDGCLVVSSVQLVNGQVLTDCCGPHAWWEGESCGGDGGSSILWGEKKIHVDNITKYTIKARLNIDDNSWVWINGAGVPGLQRGCCGWTGWVDVTNYFNTGWNTIKFKAEDTCSGGRYFNLDWDVGLKNDPPQAVIACEPPACSIFQGEILTSLNNSTDPDGQGDISKSEWDILNWGSDPDLSCAGLCNFTPQIQILGPGTFSVELYVEDKAGASDTAIQQFTIKKEAFAGFMCSLDNSNWQVCENLSPSTGETIYFKDHPSLAEHSEPSGGATITKRTWKLNATSFDSDNNQNPSLVPAEGTNTIELTILDSAARTASKTHTLSITLPLPLWKEIAPF